MTGAVGGVAVVLAGPTIVRSATEDPPPAAVAAPATTVPPAPVNSPEHLSIPSIGVDSKLVPLSANPDGTVAPPESVWDAGWFQDGPEPGEAGASVIAGHLDSRTGPAVFFRLRDLKRGDPVTIRGTDGAKATYRVDRTESFSKDRVPSTVYAPTPNPTLRLITCSGEFDRRAHHYKDNLVVYATLARA